MPELQPKEDNSLQDPIPEQEGRRMRKLREALDKALEKTVKGCTYENMSLCFPRLAVDSPETLRSAHDQVEKFIRHSVQDEFNTIVQSRNLVTKLNELDCLVDAANLKATKDKRHEMTPDAVILASSVPTKRAEAERLRGILEELRAENNALSRDIDVLEGSYTNNKKAVHELHNQIAKAAEVAAGMDPAEMDAIQADL